MKKSMITLMAVLVSASAFAAKIGYVNSQEVFGKYSQTKIIQTNLTKERERIEKDLNQKEVTLKKEYLELQAKGDKLTEKEKEAFQKKVEEMEKYARDSYAKLSKEEYNRTQEIDALMKKSIEKVAKNNKYDFILEEGAIKYGGTNITDQVIKEMESSKK